MMWKFAVAVLPAAAIGVVLAAQVRVDVATGESLVAVRDKVRAMSAEERGVQKAGAICK